LSHRFEGWLCGALPALACTRNRCIVITKGIFMPGGEKNGTACSRSAAVGVESFIWFS